MHVVRVTTYDRAYSTSYSKARRPFLPSCFYFLRCSLCFLVYLSATILTNTPFPGSRRINTLYGNGSRPVSCIVTREMLQRKFVLHFSHYVRRPKKSFWRKKQPLFLFPPSVNVSTNYTFSLTSPSIASCSSTRSSLSLHQFFFSFFSPKSLE